MKKLYVLGAVILDGFFQLEQIDSGLFSRRLGNRKMSGIHCSLSRSELPADQACGLIEKHIQLKDCCKEKNNKTLVHLASLTCAVVTVVRGQPAPRPRSLLHLGLIPFSIDGMIRARSREAMSRLTCNKPSYVKRSAQRGVDSGFALNGGENDLSPILL